jgi:hypothetical protein
LHFVERSATTLAPLELAQNAWHALVSQFGPFHPLAFPGLMLALVIAIRRSKWDDRYRFLAIASWPVLLFLYLMMVRVRDPEAHWTMVGYIPLALIAGGVLDEVARPGAALKRYVRACIATSLIALTAVFALSQFPRLRRAIPASMYDANKDPFNEMTGWSELHAALNSDANALGSNAVIASCQYALCAHILDAIDDKPRVYCPTAQRTEFDFINRRDPPASSPVLYVVDDHYHDDVASRLPNRSCRSLAPVRIEHDGIVMRTYEISACSVVATTDDQTSH